MVDLTALPVNELAEKVLLAIGHASAEPYLAELQTRANQSDEWKKAAYDDTWRGIRLEAAEKERDEAKAEADRLAADKWLAEKERDEAIQVALSEGIRSQAAEARLAAYEEPGWINPVQKVVELQARLAETQKALEGIAENGACASDARVARAALEASQ